jgi:hypothetical protein
VGAPVITVFQSFVAIVSVGMALLAWSQGNWWAGFFAITALALNIVCVVAWRRRS